MSRKNSKDLFLLIKSLNKSEKGYIKKTSFSYQEKNTNFLRLFTAIDNQDVYNEAELLQKEKYIKQLPRLKIYLYERILSSLDSYYSRKNINLSLQKMLSSVYVLQPKGLYDQCLKQLYKAKELAGRHEKFTVLLEIYDLERTLYIEQQQIGAAGKVQLEENHTIVQINNLSFFKTRYEEISRLYVEIIYTRKKAEVKQLRAVIDDKRFSNVKEALSLQAKIIYYKTLCKYYSALDDRKSYLQHAKAALTLAEKNPHYISENILQYIKLLNNYMATASENALHQEFELSMQKLKNIPLQYEHSDKKTIRSQIELRVIIREYFHSKNNYNFHRPLELMNSLEKHLGDNPLISETHRVIFYYHVAYTNFIHNNIKKAISWANRIIHTETHPDKLFFHCFARTLLLFCYYELGESSSLKYHLNSAEKFFIRNEKLYSLESIAIRFFRGVLLKQNRMSLNVLLKDLYTDLQKNFDPMEYKILEYFDIFSWYKSKTTGRSFLEVLEKQDNQKFQ
ncbi:MAG TPA: hypothetical protein VF868_04335 [Bacteroidia bacterium]|jgi:hypothetical protein